MNTLFKALNDPTRREILEMLKEGDLTAGQIADKFHISKPSISHHLDLLKIPPTLKQIIRPLQVIPETMTARDLLLQFIRDKKNVAWVVDEYGGTAGIITLEDLMEEIFGEIKDEHDEENLTEKVISSAEFIFSGRLEVDYLNNEHQLRIPVGEYTTLSGYIVSKFEDIPEAGTSIDIDTFHIKVMKATDKRIELVKLKVIEE